jgi:hypothetical protein
LRTLTQSLTLAVGRTGPAQGVRLSVKPSLFAELRRRNVFRAGAFFIAATWALAQGIAQLIPVVGAPE